MLKLASLNIEGSKHFDKLLPFFKARSLDALCLQEVFERDVPMFERELGMTGAFAPMTYKCYDDPDSHDVGAQTDAMGVAILSRVPPASVGTFYYFGSPDSIPHYVRRDPDAQNRCFIHGLIEDDGERYIVGTTHFMVTEKGEPADYQRRDTDEFLRRLESFPDIVFCGDFNAPRGGEIFGRIAMAYQDNIPAKHRTSIDGSIHRAGYIELMVDGLFTSPSYVAENVELVGGLSDHLCITAEVRTS